MHDTTEDALYVEPADVLGRLDRWADDPGVRVVGVTGIGGLGKTALIGHWLKEKRGVLRRPVKGLLCWSFNRNRDVSAFFEALCELAGGADTAIAALRMVPLVVVLDGLEVLQEPRGGSGLGELDRHAYGEFLDADLREFLDAACRLEHAGLVLLTSRFPFQDLTYYLGTSMRLLPLGHLSPEGGARLLASLGVEGSARDREEVARQLDGHPLALRVFAAALARQPHRDPARLIMVGVDPLHEKVTQLLSFYEESLPHEQRTLLGLVGLFPAEVDLGTAGLFVRELTGVAECLAGWSDAQLRQALDGLVVDGLLTRVAGSPVYACHPVVRDHFRVMLFRKDEDAASQAADLLTSALTGEPETTEQVRTVVHAIRLLLEAGQVAQADELYFERLDDGHLFWHRVLPQEGLKCALRFVVDDAQRDRLEQQPSARRLGVYFNWVGLFATHAAELNLAEQYLRDGINLYEKEGDDVNLLIGLQNIVEPLVLSGRLTDAEAAARRTLALAEHADDDQRERDSLACLGFVLDRQGRIAEALGAFQCADTVARRVDGEGLYSLRGIVLADLLLRLGRTGEARQSAVRNLELCGKHGWWGYLAHCRWLLGRLDALDGDVEAAAVHLWAAEATFRNDHQLVGLAPVLIAQADLFRRQRAWGDAQHKVEEAVRLASSRRLVLDHADALVLRGRISLDQGQDAGDADPVWAWRAIDDAEAALALAQRSGYAWAERDALVLRADARHALGDPDQAHRDRADAAMLTTRLQPQP